MSDRSRRKQDQCQPIDDDDQDKQAQDIVEYYSRFTDQHDADGDGDHDDDLKANASDRRLRRQRPHRGEGEPSRERKQEDVGLYDWRGEDARRIHESDDDGRRRQRQPDRLIDPVRAVIVGACRRRSGQRSNNRAVEADNVEQYAREFLRRRVRAVLSCAAGEAASKRRNARVASVQALLSRWTPILP